MSTNASQSGPSRGTSTVAVSFAAIGSVLAASICCLPLFPFMMAAGLAGTSPFLSQLRPYLLIGSILFIALGFYQAWRAKKCQCRTRPGLVDPAVGLCGLCFRIDSIAENHGELNRRAHPTAIL